MTHFPATPKRYTVIKGMYAGRECYLDWKYPNSDWANVRLIPASDEPWPFPEQACVQFSALKPIDVVAALPEALL